ncbi:MAG: hypothetical protein Q7T82_20610 [Armatimonadota bacterium]|nr:hypothetical protein [Armatimonadota bacterium]
MVKFLAVFLLCPLTLLVVMPCAAVRPTAKRVQKAQKHVPESTATRINSWLSHGTIPRQKGNYKLAKDIYEGVCLLSQITRNENCQAAERSAKQVARIEKLIEMEGPRSDWNKKLARAKKEIATYRSGNFDIGLLQLRGNVAAGEMAEVLGQMQEAMRLYSAGLGIQYLLSQQDLSDISADQISCFQQWGGWPRGKCEKMGVDVDEVLKRFGEKMVDEQGNPKSLVLPYL